MLDVVLRCIAAVDVREAMVLIKSQGSTESNHDRLRRLRGTRVKRTVVNQL